MCATTPNTPALLRCCPKRYEAPVKARQTDGVDLVRRIEAGDQPTTRIGKNRRDCPHRAVPAGFGQEKTGLDRVRLRAHAGGSAEEIQAERDGKLEAARQQRQVRRQRAG